MNRLMEKIDSIDRKMDFFDRKMDNLLKEQIEIKKRLKTIEILAEINNDLNFSKVSIFI